MVRGIRFLLGLLICGLLAGIAHADTFKLNSGETLNGEVLSTTANDQGVQIKVGDGQYQRVPWASFSQEDIKAFAKNPKMEPFVEPFVEPDPEAKIKKTEVHIKQPPRLARPAPQGLVGAMFGSGLGLFLIVLLYGANVYAGYEVAIFRAQPPGLVCGLAAIPLLGLAVPIIFLSMPTRLRPGDFAEQPVEAAPAAAPEAAAAAAVADEVNPMHADGAQHPSALRLAHSESEAPKSTTPETVTFQRGQFTFNRRFIETKFAGFFGVVRRDAEKDLLLVFKTTRGEYTGNRISRIAANDLHLQVQRGHATEEILIPFQDIQQIQLKHKDAHA